MRRLCTCAALCLLLLLAAVVPVRADGKEAEAQTMPPSFADVEGALDDSLAEALPDGIFSSDAEEAVDAIGELCDLRYLLGALLNAIGLRLGDAVRLLCTLVGLLLLAAVLRQFRDTVGGRGGEAFGFCLRLCLYAAIVSQGVGLVEVATAFFSRLSGLTAAFIPVMGSLYAMGGNLGQAAVSRELLLVFLSACQYVSGVLTPPVCGICMTFSLFDAFGSRLTLTPLSETVKRWYTSLLGLITFLLTLALSAQSILVARADSLAMKGVKYAVGSLIPVAGGAVSGTLGSVTAGVALLRGATGICGVILVALLLLPTLVHLLLFRGMLNLAKTVAALLGCDGEGRLLGEMASLYGYLSAAVAICSVTFVLALAFFAGGMAAA